MVERQEDRDLAASNSTPIPRERLTSIDIVRGLVMVLMTLDHVRNYFPTGYVDDAPVDPPFAIFLTRWVTHFCAPAFFLLAGVGAYLSASGGKSRAQLSWFLCTRGLALILFDLVIVRIGWDFNFDSFADFWRWSTGSQPELLNGPWLIVLTALGVAMIVLAALIYLPLPVIALISVVIIAGHNAFDWLDEEDVGRWEPLLALLHIRQTAPLGSFSFYVSYPLIPWIAVMSLGYSVGPIFRLERTARRRTLFLLGAAITIGFLVRRATGIYGDSNPWMNDEEGLDNVMAFLHTRKYPASLMYLMMTLGPIFLALAAFDGVNGRIAEWLMVFGRTPLFFYLLHLYVIHAIGLAVGVLLGYGAAAMCVPYPDLPEGYGFHLWVGYSLTVVVLLICYPLCRWFDGLKRRHKTSVWLSYL